MIYNIQGLRLIAALFIVFAHIILFGNTKYGLSATYLDHLADMLMIGVDIFFIISGFIILHTRHAQSANQKSGHSNTAAHFLYNRITRIYPVYWLLCLLLLPIFFWYPHWVNSGASEPTSLLHSFLLIPHDSVPLLMVAWTLEFEMFFYLVFALSLWLKTTRQLILLTLILGTTVLAGYLNPELGNTPTTKLITSSLVLYFVVGMWLAYIYRYLKHLNILLALTSGLLILSVIHAWSHELGAIDRFLHYAPAATCIVIITLLLEKKGWSPLKSIQKWGGNISYSMYLIHILVLSAVGKILSAFLGHGVLMDILFISATLIGSIFGASILYYLFEKPSLNILRKIAHA